MRLRGLRSLAIAAVIAVGIAWSPLCRRGSFHWADGPVQVAAVSSLPRIAARPYKFRAPAVIDPTRSYPLIIGLHGLGGSGANFSRYFRVDQLVDEMGFVVAFPDGSVEREGTARRHFWNAINTCCDC